MNILITQNPDDIKILLDFRKGILIFEKCVRAFLKNIILTNY
jgi:hypothetical protein